MVGYILHFCERSLWQLWTVFGVAMFLACCLQVVGRKIRTAGVGRLGDLYWYLVAPGVACHETGHAVGCILTGTKIIKFVPFCRDRDTLGYVLHEKRTGLLGGVADFVIASGPVWFGGLVIVFLTCLFSCSTPRILYRDYFPVDSMPGLLSYGCGLFRAAGDLLSETFGASDWGLGLVVWLYLTFCIASEIGLSPVDLLYMKRGLLCIALLTALLNLIPPVGMGVSALVFALMPFLFKLHVLMATALTVNIVIMLIVRLVARWRGLRKIVTYTFVL